MKIIFLKSHQPHHKIPEMVYGCSYTLYPTPDLAALYNAAVLEKAGHEVSLFEENENTPLPSTDAYFINSVILSYSADMALAKKLKNKKVYFFGPYPTLYPEKYLNYPNHFVLRGETEHYIVEALQKPTKTKGVSYKNSKDKVINNSTAGLIEDLDSLPFPAREIDDKSYFNPKLNFRKFTNVLSSRGCANRCYFCVPNSISWARELEWKKTHVNKPPVKIRSAQNILAELKELKKQGYEEFSFIDDQFVVGKDRVIMIADGIKKLHFKFGLLARADRLHDHEIIKKLAQAGCVYVDLGVESFDQEILDDIKKDIQVETILETINWLNKYKIEPKINIMMGTSPKENVEKIAATIQQTLKLPVNYCMFSIATPFPGTELEKIARKKGWINKSKEFNPAGIASINYPHLKSKDLEMLARKANNKFYFRPRIILKQLDKIRSWKSARLLYITIVNWRKNLSSKK